MDHVSAHVRDLCQMDRCGGRVSKPDAGVWEVYDVAHWTEAHATSKRARFPSLSVSVASCRRSLSGFCVVITLERSSHAWTSVLVCAVMLTTMGALARSLAPHTCVLF